MEEDDDEIQPPEETEQPDEDETEPSEETQPPKVVPRNKRGPIRASSVTPPDGVEWTIKIKNGQLVSNKSISLTNLMGTYARAEQYFPLHLQWHNYPIGEYSRWFNHINQKYKFVNEVGTVVIAANAMKAIKPVLQRIIRDNNAAWKEHYDGKTPTELLKNPLKSINDIKWTLLVKYWNDRKLKEISKQNKINRQLLKPTHTLRTKNVGHFYEEERTTVGDENFVFVHSYVKAHKKADGTFPNEKTETLCNKVAMRAAEEHIDTSADPERLIPILDEVCGGHHGGYERGIGLGALLRRGDGASNSSNTIDVNAIMAELQEMHEERNAFMEERKRIELRWKRQDRKGKDCRRLCSQCKDKLHN